LGPGDVVSGAVAWLGLRAYSSAQATGTQPAIDIVKTSDGSAPMTINILSTGALDVATIAGLGYGVSVTKWYDQTGNNNHVTQATLANMPVITLSAIGTLPAMTFIGNKKLSKTLFTEAQPTTISTVARLIDCTSATHTLLGNSTYALTLDNGQPPGGPAAPQLLGSGGAITVYPTTINVWHAMNGVFNSTSSDFSFDGVSGVNTADTGTGSPSNQVLDIGGTNSNFNLCEIGSWGIAFNGTQIANMSLAVTGNQRVYWGF
jgi:hypothetical protein